MGEGANCQSTSESKIGLLPDTLCRQNGVIGQFWTVLVRMEDRRESPITEIVSRCRQRATRVYYGAVFEVKKEIPDKMLINETEWPPTVVGRSHMGKPQL